MVNVGLRAYVWQQKTPEQQVIRADWRLNDNTYAALREYTAVVKAMGFPGQGPGNGLVPAIPVEEAPRTGLVFTGMAELYESERERATVLAWGNQTPSKLAWGTASGTVRMALVNSPAGVIHDRRAHRKPITDLDFSPDDHFLLSVAADGNLCIWLTEDGQLARTFMAKSPIQCARFVPGNASLALLGTATGHLVVYNASSGREQDRVSLRSKQGHEDQGAVQAMAASGSLLLVASSSGALCTFRCHTLNGVLQPLRALASCQLSPARKPAAVASLATATFSGHCQGPALLVSFETCQLGLYRVNIADGVVDLLCQSTVPPAARPIKAAFCPAVGSIATPEHIAMGAEDTGLCAYDLAHNERVGVYHRLQGHTAPVVDCKWSPCEQLLASCDCDGLVIVWKRA